MPPRLLVEIRLIVPEKIATSGVPRAAIMSTPWWVRPPDLGAPQESVKETAPATGQAPFPEAGGVVVDVVDAIVVVEEPVSTAVVVVVVEDEVEVVVEVVEVA